MGKLIFWLVVVFAVLFVLRLVNAAKAQRRRRDAARPAVEDMVRCVNCGTYVPRAEAKPGPRGLTCGDVKCLSR